MVMESPQQGSMCDSARTCNGQPDPEARKAIANASGARPIYFNNLIAFVFQKYKKSFLTLTDRLDDWAALSATPGICKAIMK
jgi:hypothetical protein